MGKKDLTQLFLGDRNHLPETLIYYLDESMNRWVHDASDLLDVSPPDFVKTALNFLAFAKTQYHSGQALFANDVDYEFLSRQSSSENELIFSTDDEESTLSCVLCATEFFMKYLPQYSDCSVTIEYQVHRDDEPVFLIEMTSENERLYDLITTFTGTAREDVLDEALKLAQLVMDAYLCGGEVRFDTREMLPSDNKMNISFLDKCRPQDLDRPGPA